MKAEEFIDNKDIRRWFTDTYDGEQISIIDLLEEYHQYKLQALKEDVLKEVIWAEENQVCEDDERHIEWNRGYRNAMKTVLNLITNIEKK